MKRYAKADLSPVIADALDAHRSALAERYASMVRRAFTAMVNKLGPRLHHITNDYTYARNFRLLVAPNVRQEGKRVEFGCVVDHGVYVIDEGRLTANADVYASDVAHEWAGKIAAKLGQLDEASVESLGNLTFLIKGSRGGRRITIEQTVVLKASPRGKLFNQFPARIYVDGKFTSEAAYRRMFT